jgi:hypothetical protein
MASLRHKPGVDYIDQPVRLNDIADDDMGGSALGVGQHDPVVIEAGRQRLARQGGERGDPPPALIAERSRASVSLPATTG